MTRLPDRRIRACPSFPGVRRDHHPDVGGRHGAARGSRYRCRERRTPRDAAEQTEFRLQPDAGAVRPERPDAGAGDRAPTVERPALRRPPAPEALRRTPTQAVPQRVPKPVGQERPEQEWRGLRLQPAQPVQPT